MKAIVFGCKYPQIAPYFAKLWNKYFTEDIDVTIVTQGIVNESRLPHNFKTFKLSSYTRSWVNDVSEFFRDFNDELFFGCMEDHFLYKMANIQRICLAYELMTKNKEIVKFGTTIPWPDQLIATFHGSDGIPKEFRYKYKDFISPVPIIQSLCPAIWRTDFFKLMLEKSKDYTAWEFETRPETKACYHIDDSIKEYLKDKVSIYFPEEPFPMIDLVRSGKSNEKQWRQKATGDDISIFEEARDSTGLTEVYHG